MYCEQTHSLYSSEAKTYLNRMVSERGIKSNSKTVASKVLFVPRILLRSVSEALLPFAPSKSVVLAELENVPPAKPVVSTTPPSSPILEVAPSKVPIAVFTPVNEILEASTPAPSKTSVTSWLVVNVALSIVNGWERSGEIEIRKREM